MRANQGRQTRPEGSVRPNNPRLGEAVNNDTSPKPIQLSGLSNVLAGTLQLDGKSTLAQTKVLANESAAWLWVDGTVTAGTGTAPAWVVEEKFAPFTTQLKGESILTWFAVMANIGNNKVGGQTAKDVIDFLGPSLKNDHDWKKESGWGIPHW